MKQETKVSDIKTLIAMSETANVATNRCNVAKASAERAIDYGVANAPDIMAAINSAREAMAAKNQAEKAFAKLPKERRTMAQSAVTMALEIGKRAASMCGSDYSGDTSYGASWGNKATAGTSTDRGEQYSRKCTFHKTNASHHVTLDPGGIPCLVENEALRLCSIRDGLHLIALYPDSSCVWVRNRGKAIVSESGWIAGNASVCFHSLKSAEDAKRGFERKLATLRREQEQQRRNQKDERRARLVARLCSITATLQDAKSLGFCSPGIQAFQSRFNIGDSATLPQLMATKDPSAIRLALHIARNAKHQTA